MKALVLVLAVLAFAIGAVLASPPLREWAKQGREDAVDWVVRTRAGCRPGALCGATAADLQRPYLAQDFATWGNGPYWAINNVWGRGKRVNGTDYAQRIVYDPATFPNNVKVLWNWPKATAVLAYPEIVFGGRPWWPERNSTQPRPAQVANLTNLSATFAFEMAGQTDHSSVAFDLWLTSSPLGGPRTVKDEIILFVHNPWEPDPPSFEADGFGISVKTADYAIAGGQTWQLITGHAGADRLTGSVNLAAILKTLIWQKVISGEEYLLGVETGAEMSGGFGSLTINSLAVAWDSAPTIIGTEGDDAFAFAAPANRHVFGNGGADTVSYDGARFRYDLMVSGPRVSVIAKGKPGVLDALDGVRNVGFADGTYDVRDGTFVPSRTER